MAQCSTRDCNDRALVTTGLCRGCTYRRENPKASAAALAKPKSGRKARAA